MEKASSCVEDVKKSSFWNLLSSGLYAISGAVILIAIANTQGVLWSGYFSYASATSYILLTIGELGVRYLHSSDVKYTYNFKEYRFIRILSCILMIAFTFFYGIRIGSQEKFIILILFAIFKLSIAIEDLYGGELQRQGHLKISCFLLTIRYFVYISLSVILIFITKNTILSLGITGVLTFIMMAIDITYINKNFVIDKSEASKDNIKRLLLDAAPIFFGLIINTYLVNICKFSIEEILGSEVQGYYGYLSMPVFTINLLCVSIYNPMIKRMSELYVSNSYEEYIDKIKKTILIIIGLSLAIIAFGYIIGLKLVGIVYNADLSTMMVPFIILLAGGGFDAMYVYFTRQLTIMRKQQFILYINIFVLILMRIIINAIVSKYGILGAACSFLLSNSLLCALGFIALLVEIKKWKK